MGILSVSDMGRRICLEDLMDHDISQSLLYDDVRIGRIHGITRLLDECQGTIV